MRRGSEGKQVSPDTYHSYLTIPYDLMLYQYYTHQFHQAGCRQLRTVLVHTHAELEYTDACRTQRVAPRDFLPHPAILCRWHELQRVSGQQTLERTRGPELPLDATAVLLLDVPSL